MKMELSESQIKEMIRKQIINEFRGGDFGENDGDHMYVTPSGDNNILTNLKWNQYHGGKRAKTNFKYDDTPVNRYSHGKGDMCFRALEAMKKELTGNEKVEWTEDEKKLINGIISKLGELAILTKKEGNEKRGYNGPKSMDKEEGEPALSLAEQRIKNTVRNVLKEDSTIDWAREHGYSESDIFDTSHNHYSSLFHSDSPTKRISELSYDEAIKALGIDSSCSFEMPYFPESENGFWETRIHNSSEFEDKKAKLIDKYGDIVVRIVPPTKRNYFIPMLKTDDKRWTHDRWAKVIAKDKEDRANVMKQHREWLQSLNK